MREKVLTLYYTFNLIQLLYLKNIETESLNRVMESFAKSFLNFKKLERPAISVIEPSKKTR